MSKNVAGTDAGIGRGVFTTKLQLTMQAARACFWFGAIPGLLLPLVIWFSFVTEQDFDIVKLNIVSSFVRADSHSEWRIRDGNGVRQVISAVTDDGQRYNYLTPGQVRLSLKSKWAAVGYFQLSLLLSMVCAIVGFCLVWYTMSRIGKRSQENNRVRGAQDLVPPKELSRLVCKQEKATPPKLYTLVDVAIPQKAPMAGILMLGAQGTGKSIAIHDLMLQVFAKKKKCIIYDQSGEFYKAHFRPGMDFFFNPAFEGSVPWSIFSEMRYVYDADTLAQAFLPPKGGVVHGAAAFFEDAARALFSVILKGLTEAGAQNTSDIAKAFLDMPEDQMAKITAKTVANSAIGKGSPGQKQGVISSISIYLNGIAAVGAGSWSLRDFLARDDDARFFILSTEDTKAMFAPLFRLLLAVSFAVIESKGEIVHDDRYWYFLDESHVLGDIRLDDKLATLRKFGVAIVSGIQAESQYMSSLGKERGETVLNCFNTLLTLRLNEPAMKEHAALRLDKQDIDMVSQNQALAVTEWRDGAGMARTQQERWLVMPSEIGGLGTCEGYLKLAGSLPATKVNYLSWTQPHAIFDSRVSKFNPVQQLPERDKRFLIARRHEPGTVDPFEVVANYPQEGTEPDKSGTPEPQSSAPGAGPAPVTPTAATAPNSGSSDSQPGAAPAAPRNSNSAGGKGHSLAQVVQQIPLFAAAEGQDALQDTSQDCGATQANVSAAGQTGEAKLSSDKQTDVSLQQVQQPLRDAQQNADGASRTLPLDNLYDGQSL